MTVSFRRILAQERWNRASKIQDAATEPEGGSHRKSWRSCQPQFSDYVRRLRYEQERRELVQTLDVNGRLKADPISSRLAVSMKIFLNGAEENG